MVTVVSFFISFALYTRNLAYWFRCFCCNNLDIVDECVKWQIENVTTWQQTRQFYGLLSRVTDLSSSYHTPCTRMSKIVIMCIKYTRRSGMLDATLCITNVLYWINLHLVSEIIPNKTLDHTFSYHLKWTSLIGSKIGNQDVSRTLHMQTVKYLDYQFFETSNSHVIHVSLFEHMCHLRHNVRIRCGQNPSGLIGNTRAEQ